MEPDGTHGIPLDQLVPRYVGLNVAREPDDSGPGRIPPDGNGLSNAFIAALLLLAERGRNIDFTGQQFEVARQLAIRSHRKSFERDADTLLTDLAQQIEQLERESQPMLDHQQRDTILRLLRGRTPTLC